MRRWTARLLFWSGGLLILLGIAYASLITYVAWREQSSPSTRQVLVLADGRRIPLIQPTPAADVLETQPSTASTPKNESTAQPSASASTSAIEPQQAPISTTARPDLLPPERIEIPRIDLDRPVVLADKDSLPRFKGAGWFIGSGWPGVAGNMVLFDHCTPEYGIFGRLTELRPGDEFSVFTADQEYRYRVRSSRQTTRKDVAVLAPTDNATATLITCTGPPGPDAQTSAGRLVVTADYVGE